MSVLMSVLVVGAVMMRVFYAGFLCHTRPRGSEQSKDVEMSKDQPLVGLIMGSQSDWAVMRYAAVLLDELHIPYEARIVSAHRTPQRLYRYAMEVQQRGIQVVIAGAGGAAHLPGMTAALTPLPVLGVPMESGTLKGVDSLLSIVQMPAGVPVGTLAIGRAGAINAALLAAMVIGLSNPAVAVTVAAWRQRNADGVAEQPFDHSA